ncbi:Protein STRUBBELIG-RECEPTOR FAMILY 3 [Linum perenne]
MGLKRSGTGTAGTEWLICAKFLLGFALIWAVQGATNNNDVAAINSLYASLGSPVLPGWVASAGDPCGEAWQGVQCNASEIQSIDLSGANLGGVLGATLGSFTSIKSIDLSNNLIGGTIPSSLPPTLQSLSLSGNNLTGSIPDTVSSLSLLTDMSLSKNSLSGEIPDAFQSLTGLINLDLSGNNLSGMLPPSFTNLVQLSTLHLQDNTLSGTVDVLQDLPLQDLNIENNLFSGSIPDKMLSIPTFNKDGNSFNATTPIAPLPSPSSPTILPSTPSPPGTPPPPTTSSTTTSSTSPPTGKSPGRQAKGPSSSPEQSSGKKSVKRVVWIAIAGAAVFIIMVLVCLMFMPKCCRRREEGVGYSKRHQVGEYQGNREHPRDNSSLFLPTSQPQVKQDQKESMSMPMPMPQAKKDQPMPMPMPKPQAKKDHPVLQKPPERKLPPVAVAVPKKNDYAIDLSRLDSMDIMHMPPPPPPPPPPPNVDKLTVNPLVSPEPSAAKPPTKARNVVTSARTFTIASLQQYTNSFSQDNLIGGGMLGTVYRAERPNGKFLAVKKLDRRASTQRDDEFLDMINNIDRIRHANVVELMGYCAEHDQRLLIYEYCSNGTLQDMLHTDDELKDNLSWNTRIRMALGAARALEYLHEVCQPPIIHRNFKSANILLDDDLDVRVSDCGLAPLISSGSVRQLSGQLLTAYGYGAPEFESGIYTTQSDVYSFGVVMLELLTGRKSYDRSRNRGEQFLVRWAIPQLHDIDAISRMVDPSLQGQYIAKSLSNFADIISRCVQSEPEFRPQMSEVVQDLTNMIRRERPSNESIGD